jgi:hypothetical protein
MESQSRLDEDVERPVQPDAGADARQFRPLIELWTAVELAVAPKADAMLAAPVLERREVVTKVRAVLQ